MRREDLHRCIVRILDAEGVTIGAGFVVSADGLIVTCAHVIVDAGRGPGETVAVAFEGATTDPGPCTAHVIPEFWRDPRERDIAILKFEGAFPEGILIAALGPSQEAAQHTVFVIGFPKFTRESRGHDESARPSSIAGEGTVIATLQRRPPPEFETGSHRVLQLRSSEITAGFSGGPLLSEVHGYIVGMVDSMLQPDEFDKLRDAAFATPSEALWQACPELLLVALSSDSQGLLRRFLRAIGIPRKYQAPLMRAIAVAVMGASAVWYLNPSFVGTVASLREGPLSGARVDIIGSNCTSVTASNGFFAIDHCEGLRWALLFWPKINVNGREFVCPDASVMRWPFRNYILVDGFSGQCRVISSSVTAPTPSPRPPRPRPETNHDSGVLDLDVPRYLDRDAQAEQERLDFDDGDLATDVAVEDSRLDPQTADVDLAVVIPNAESAPSRGNVWHSSLMSGERAELHIDNILGDAIRSCGGIQTRRVTITLSHNPECVWRYAVDPPSTCVESHFERHRRILRGRCVFCDFPDGQYTAVPPSQ